LHFPGFQLKKGVGLSDTNLSATGASFQDGSSSMPSILITVFIRFIWSDLFDFWPKAVSVNTIHISIVAILKKFMAILFVGISTFMAKREYEIKRACKQNVTAYQKIILLGIF
jgi:hypothetical protein